MTQYTARRRRHGAGKGRTALLRGILTAVAVTAAAVCAFAVIIAFTDMEDRFVRVINQLIKAGAVAAGTCAAVDRGDGAGIRRGIGVGLAYMGVGVLLYALLSGQRFQPLSYALDLGMGAAAGGLTGMLRAGMEPKGK